MKISPAALQALVKDDLVNFIVATTPGGIEAQEAVGQQTLVMNDMLPKTLGYEEQRSQYEALGIVFGDDADDLFVHVKLPLGWHKDRTDHSMWSNLVDDKGHIRAQIFYKAAFYDRSAYMHLCRRYRVTCQPVDGYEGDYCNRPYVDVVLDQEVVIWQSKDTANDRDYRKHNLLQAAAQEWLREHYPDYENPLFYWD